MTDTWRLLRTWEGEPAFNMGLDEVLLECGDPRPVLRLYTWKPAALSLGYFQRLADVPPEAHGLPLVRRFTGGGAIHHEHELTFSIAADQSHPLYRGPVADSYRRVHAVIASCLQDLGVDAHAREEEELASEVAGSAMCFHASTPIDLVWGGRKGVGSAQRRTGGRVLHHGSIKLDTTPLEGPIASLQRAGQALSPQDLGEKLVARFRDRGMEFVEERVGEDEAERADRSGQQYASPAFLERR